MYQKSRFYTWFLVMVLLPLAGISQWIPLDKDNLQPQAPEITVLEQTGTYTILELNVYGFKLESVNGSTEMLQQVDLLTDTWMTGQGAPAVPYKASVLAVPDNSPVTVEVIDAGESFEFQDIDMAPARPSWVEGAAEPPYTRDYAVYDAKSLFPHYSVSNDDPAVFRDFRICRIALYPVKYNPADKKLVVTDHMIVKVSYSGDGEVVNPKKSASKGITPSYASLYRGFIENYDQVLQQRFNGKEEGEELMLCIMPDEFEESFQPYAEWKRQSGINIHVTTFSDINANSSNPDIIKNHISDAYYNWDTPPSYVLIIGDNGVFPHEIVTYPDYSFPNEDFFVEVDGDDYFPDMMIGRFTNQGDYRMRVMINKYQLYEQYPYVDDPSWFTKGVCCSNNAYESQVETKRFAAACMRDDGGFAVDTMMSDGDGWGGWGCTYDNDDIVDRINEGRSYLNYRGEGWYSGWSATCYDFGVNDVSNLNNGQKFTFVSSIGCGVAGFHSQGGNCFGEEWVQLGSISSPRGGIGFIGPTSNTHTTYNNRIDKGIYVGMFREGMNTPGQALLRGKLYMYNVFGNEYYVEYHYKVFCVLGDPSIHIWKHTPRHVSTGHITEIQVGNNVIEVQVNYDDNGEPAKDALVTITGAGVFATAYCDSTGLATLNIAPAIADTLMVTACGDDVYPQQSEIIISQPDELVEPEGDPLITDLDGNNDGLVNPNEHCTLTFDLKNWGVATVVNTQAVLTTSHPEAEVVQGTVTYGDIAAGETITGDPFEVFVSETCNVGESITFNLHVSTSASEWDYSFVLDIHGCDLSLESMLVYETNTANVDYRLNPGEEANLYLAVNNPGEDFAPGVTGILSSNDPYITILDDNGFFGDCPVNGDDVISWDDYYRVAVNSECPTDYLAHMTVSLSTNGGNYPFEKAVSFELPVGMAVSQDYTGPDEYGYYAYASDDAFYDQTPEYQWVEIDQSGTVLELPELSDYTETVDLPFDFMYYGINYNQIRISTDGWIAFGPGDEVNPLNSSLPANDNVNAMVAAFWTDLHSLAVAEGAIYYHHDAENHAFVIEYDSIAHNVMSTEPLREVFQVLLLDPAYYPTNTGDGEIIVQYRVVKDQSQITVGIENHNQNIGLQYLYNSNYSSSAARIFGGTAIKFTTEAPFVSNAVGVSEYEQSGNIVINSNYPNPFSESTTLEFTVRELSNLLLEVYNATGKRVKTLSTGMMQKGTHRIVWDGTWSDGSKAPAGMYLYRIGDENASVSGKMFLVR